MGESRIQQRDRLKVGSFLGTEDVRRPLGAGQRIVDITHRCNLRPCQGWLKSCHIYPRDPVEARPDRNELGSVRIQETHPAGCRRSAPAVVAGRATKPDHNLITSLMDRGQELLTHPEGCGLASAAIVADQGQASSLGQFDDRCPARKHTPYGADPVSIGTLDDVRAGLSAGGQQHRLHRALTAVGDGNLHHGVPSSFETVCDDPADLQ